MFKHYNTKKKKHYCTHKTRVMSLILINRHHDLKQKFKYSNTYQFILNRHYYLKQKFEYTNTYQFK